MKTWQGYVHAGVVALSVWFCRETIFEALQWWNGRPPSDGLLLGFCILSAGLACVPIVALHFSHELVGKPFVTSLSFLFIHLLFTAKGGFAQAKQLVQLNMFTPYLDSYGIYIWFFTIIFYILKALINLIFDKS